MLRDDTFRPIVVCAIDDDELEFIVRSQREILQRFFSTSPEPGVLISTMRDARIHSRNIDRATGLQRHRIAGIAQGGQSVRQLFCASGFSPVTHTVRVACVATSVSTYRQWCACSPSWNAYAVSQ